MMAQSRRLLLVEDLGLVSQLAPALTQAGWTVQSCTSAREAVYVAKQHEVDSLLIAATLADERGDVVFYQLAALRSRLRTHTVFLTRTDHEWEVVQTTHRLSLQLPVTPDEVVRALRGLYDAPAAS